MNITFFSTIETILLVIALSVDAFVASFAYGTNKIKIPFISIIVISTICSAFLALSLFLGSILKPMIATHLTSGICFSILFILGVVKLFDSSIKTFIRKHSNIKKELKFSLFNLSFILNVYADPQKADTDLSRELSPFEASSLAVALSLDGLAVGIGAGLASVNFIEIIIISLIFGIIAVLSGCYIGYKIAEKTSLNLSWISGVLLIILAIIKI